MALQAKSSLSLLRFLPLLYLLATHEFLFGQESARLTMIFGGDVTLTGAFENDVGGDLSFPFQRSRWLGDVDITMVNFENPMTSRGNRIRKEYNFRCNPKYVTLLKDAGIDIVTLANNHVYDFGDEGVFDTIDLLDSAGIKHVGAGKNLASARSPFIFHARGKRIVFLAYLDSVRTSSLLFATDSTAGPANADLSAMQRDIQAIRDSADFIVVNLHWGIEKSREPTERQVELAHRLIDFGADLIIGHHPHRLQAIERYHGKVIAYSLGNFVFGGNRRNTYLTAALKITVDSLASRMATAQLVPVQVRKWQPLLLTGRRAAALVRYVKRCSSRFPESIFKKR